MASAITSPISSSPAEIVASAVALSRTPGVAGLDLLAYRFAGEVEPLISAVVAAVDCPVVVAGSIASLERVRTACRLGAWAFTVGSAAFDLRFAGEKNLRGQLSAILDAADQARSGRHEVG